jgi:DNA-nicking Smr family endonuclease
MGKRKVSDNNNSAIPAVSEQQLRRTQAEIADQSGEMPELDLHGQTGQEASLNVFDYVTRMADSGESCRRIVHGKGTGVLQQVVTDELEDLMQQNVTETYFQSQKYPGAAIVVVFPI